MRFENQSQIQTMNGEQQQNTTRTSQRQQILVPPMRYDLKQATGQTVLNHLVSLLHDSNITTEETADHIRRFMQRLKNNPHIIIQFGYIPAPPHSQVTRRVIGIDGYFFKMTTSISEVDLIWHDRKNNTFLFWGASVFNVVKAMNSIRWRIHKCYTIPPTPPKREDYKHVEDISDDEDYVPELIDTDRNIISSGCVPDHENGTFE